MYGKFALILIGSSLIFKEVTIDRKKYTVINASSRMPPFRRVHDLMFLLCARGYKAPRMINWLYFHSVFHFCKMGLFTFIILLQLPAIKWSLQATPQHRSRKRSRSTCLANS